ncbi:DinB family protein [Kineococcus aurantiacus]|uniref:Putative damage-inducible protein DinB n=1 Tax=Kineococcus aurantiacus TaxID=37633 RepID=A0A7Y9DPG1_9ACTN|nr:putative damage-inducible protein DinB [Kineococcus aurantiacus]
MSFRVPPAPPRDEPPLVAGERETLAGFLDYQRLTFARKVEGLSAQQLRLRSVEPSSMSLLGLARHLADVERLWWRAGVAGEDVGPRYWSAQDPDGEFDRVDEADPAADLAELATQQDLARAVLAAHSLDDTFEHHRQGTTSVRWVLAHLLEEYARHNGHADLLRERIDGATGE